MSFVPAPQQANAAGANHGSSPALSAQQAAAAATKEAALAAEAPVSDQELVFKMRTFDVFWIDKSALMYRDGIAKVRRN
jgi:hypothetical protein|eukprot:scaffold225557_cov53-Attheya_sp.AAC.1